MDEQEPNMPADPGTVYTSADDNVLAMVIIVDRGDSAEMMVQAKHIDPATFADMLESAVDRIRAAVAAAQAKRN